MIYKYFIRLKKCFSITTKWGLFIRDSVSVRCQRLNASTSRTGGRKITYGWKVPGAIESLRILRMLLNKQMSHWTILTFIGLKLLSV